MSVVYVPQEPMRRDRISGELVTKFSMADAEKYGEVRFIANWNEGGRNSDGIQVSNFFVKHMVDFDSDEDYILPVGNPALIAIVGAIAARLGNGRFRQLIWDRIDNRYNIQMVDISHAP